MRQSRSRNGRGSKRQLVVLDGSHEGTGYITGRSLRAERPVGKALEHLPELLARTGTEDAESAFLALIDGSAA